MARLNTSADFDVTVGPKYGYVFSAEAADNLRQAHEIRTQSSFIVQYTTTNYGRGLGYGPKNQVRWGVKMDQKYGPVQFDGVPYFVIGSKILDCHQGKERQEAIKRARVVQRRVKHPEKKSRLQLRPTKKLGCPARLVIREIIKFPEFKISMEGSKVDRSKASDAIKKSLQQGLKLGERRFYVYLPSEDDHEGHYAGKDDGMIMRVDKRVINFIRHKTIFGGIQTPTEMAPIVVDYIKNDLFKDAPLPSAFNRRFFPETSDIRQHMLMAKKMEQPGLDQNDQYCLETFIQEMQKCANSQDKFFLRKSEYSSSLLFVHQSTCQRRLLLNYGQGIAFLDAAHRTIDYVIPLYFVAVKTNFGYMIVAMFVIQDANRAAIRDALTVLSQWNPEWNPKIVMTDNDDEEISAVEEVFPECEVLLCDYHRSHAWARWVSKDDSKDRRLMLSLMACIASANTYVAYIAAKANLEASDSWRNNHQTREYFERQWLPKYQRWAWAFRDKLLRININTNNGLDRRNRAHKDEYLKKNNKLSLSRMVQTLVNDFIPERIGKYKRYNNRASGRSRKYGADIPAYLHNRPADVIKRCLETAEAARQLQADDIMRQDNDEFLVRSLSRQGDWYRLSFGGSDPANCPSCTCHRWNQEYLPCKHFMAVFNHTERTWYDLPVAYRNSPLLTIDDDWMTTQVFAPSCSDPNDDGNQNAYYYENIDSAEVATEEEVSTMDESKNSSMQEPTSQSSLHLLQEQCRIELQLIRDLTFTASDSNTLTEILEVLQQIKSKIDKPLQLPEAPKIAIANTMGRGMVRDLLRQRRAQSNPASQDPLVYILPPVITPNEPSLSAKDPAVSCIQIARNEITVETTLQ